MSHPAPSTPAPATGRGRRELTVAVLLCALSGGLALSASGEPWADVTIMREPPLPPTAEVLTGSQAAPLVAACGLLLLAAALAVIAVRGAGRVVVGLLVAVSGGVLGWSGLRAVTGSLDLGSSVATSGIGLGQAQVTVDPVATWPAVAVVAGLLGVLAGALVVLRGREWPGMGRRYERTGRPADAAPAPARPTRPARPETDEDRHQAAWKALDRGDDPTV
ncbi:TIGR02234 family membrane protein [Modestobacter sp. VKM Ac-2985]|uniref:TIGR02234 family membrane protein n=1 Tax=Modestobacter sp. VKM Ac-2985 TaxID=3004139 RepID=UPI0022ABC001|nr:TIGR02234 family membrane protein [Modestobacter sp. VKM Ac-2985]MCZ2837401.1 TIGR02234 family membrane protein [Modestobacter sp. VKM Ac-2985]